MSQEIRNAATAVVLRDSDRGLETLLLRRHQQLKVGGGHWVFPGGTIDPEDGQGAATVEDAARVAAVRETMEEAGFCLDAQTLHLISHWTTPPGMGRRFATWFFLCQTEVVEVVVDGEEMDEYHWATPGEFLHWHRSGEMPMMPPTVVTLTELSLCSSVAEAQSFYRRRKTPFYEPQINKHLGVLCMLYAGDAGFDAADPSLPGARNRCYLEDSVWRHEFYQG